MRPVKQLHAVDDRAFRGRILHGAREARALAVADHAPRRLDLVARDVDLELGVAVAAVLEALTRDAASGRSEQRRQGTIGAAVSPAPPTRARPREA